jgi:hypothetical protein
MAKYVYTYVYIQNMLLSVTLLEETIPWRKEWEMVNNDGEHNI